MKAVLALLTMFLLGAPALAQDTYAILLEGWRHEVRGDVHYYRCANPDCAAGSVLSYKEQPHRTTISLADYEKHHRGLVAQNKGAGRIRDVRLSEIKERKIEGVRVMQVSREVDWDDNTTTFTIEARLIGPDRSFSLVSDSPKREWTANNLDGVLRGLVAIAGVKRP